MKKETLSLFIFLATIIAITTPLVILTSGATTDTFSVSTTVGNSAPQIVWVEAPTETPNAGTTKVITIDFNVTDNNSVTDIDTASSSANITKAGEADRLSTACWSVSNSSDQKTQRIRCNITIYYYDADGAWDICVYATDGTASDSDCTSSDLTMNSLDDISVVETSLSFSGSPGEQDVAATENPLTINNTGNQVYTGIDLTAYNLTGGGDTIGATNFAVNTTASGGPGNQLSHGSPVTITGASLNKGATATEELYFYLDIPSGITATTYNSVSNWVIDPTGN